MQSVATLGSVLATIGTGSAGMKTAIDMCCCAMYRMLYDCLTTSLDEELWALDYLERACERYPFPVE